MPLYIGGEEMSEKTGLVTVIIPVYNVEKYLHRCVDSVINQTYRNLEIFLVDDGSTDSSALICDEYAKKDSRVKVLHKENGGVSSARNLGLKNATGEYLTFVDSDDYILLTCIEKMVRGMEENDVDMVAVNWKDQNGAAGDNNGYCEENCCKIIGQDFEKTIRVMVWGYLYRRSWLEIQFFDESIFYGEDALFVISNFFAKKGSKIFMIGEPLYISVRDRADSLMNLSVNEKLFTSVKAWNQILECVRDYDKAFYNVEKSRGIWFFELYLMVLETNQKKKYKQIVNYLKKEIITLRKEGYRPSDKKENFIEILYLYFYDVLRCYLKIKKRICKK